MVLQKLSPRRLLARSNSKVIFSHAGSDTGGCGIKWELRPGGMLVQKRGERGSEEDRIKIRVSYGHQCHEISLKATSTFGELKETLSMVIGLEAREMRLIFRGKERENHEHLHMVGVGNIDKVLVIEDPAIKERKLRGLAKMRSPYYTFNVYAALF